MKNCLNKSNFHNINSTSIRNTHIQHFFNLFLSTFSTLKPSHPFLKTDFRFAARDIRFLPSRCCFVMFSQALNECVGDLTNVKNSIERRRIIFQFDLRVLRGWRKELLRKTCENWEFMLRDGINSGEVVMLGVEEGNLNLRLLL